MQEQVSSTFKEWCTTTAALDATKIGAQRRIIYWCREALADEHMPLDESCQSIYDYLRAEGAEIEEIETFYDAWEASGRIVDVDCDFEESDTLSSSSYDYYTSSLSYSSPSGLDTESE